MNPDLYILADAIGHVDLHDAQLVFGTPEDMLLNAGEFPGLNTRDYHRGPS
jgi:hypothetical protein